MAKARFSTVPEDFLHVAEGTHAHLKVHGFRVAVETPAIEYPRTPTLVAIRGHTRLFVEIAGRLDKELALVWVRYGRSCGSDVQVAFAIPNAPGVSQADMEFCTTNRIGVFTTSENGVVTELVSPVDLGLHVELPELGTLPRALRSIAAPFYRKFERGDWRDGFADACLAVEEMSRKYLKSRIKKPAVSVLDKNGRPISLTSKSINKATLGQLGKYFLGISTPNACDSLLAKSLPTINPDRIGAVHKRRSAAIERRLRASAGKQMYTILNCLRELSQKH